MISHKLLEYTEEARQAISYAREEALLLRHRLIGTEHLLLGMLRVNDPLISNIFAAFDLQVPRLRQAIEFIIGRSHKAMISDPILIPATRSVLNYAELEAEALEARQVGIEHLLLGLLCEREGGTGVTIEILESFGMTLDATRLHIIELLHDGRDQLTKLATYQARYNLTPTLNLVSRDLTMAALAGSLDPLIGRETELERTMQILARRSKNNPVLVGQAGVGKTAIAEGLALRIIHDLVPEPLWQKRVVSLDVGLLTVDTKFRGDFEERLRMIMQEVINVRDIIIFIDELHTLIGSTVSEGALSAANLFKPMLARGEVQCLGASTHADYQRFIRSDSALERRFQQVQVPETNEQETLAILEALSERYASFHQVNFTAAALQAAVQLSTRFLPQRVQPDKAIDLLDEAASRLRVQNATAPAEIQNLRHEHTTQLFAKNQAIKQHDFPLALMLRKQELRLRERLYIAEQDWLQQRRARYPVVDSEQIAEIVALKTGIPTARLTATEAERLLHLEEALHQRVIGQDQGIEAVARAVRRSRTNLSDRRHPLGSFLFAGPTGVGKTELARALAQALFGDENALFKLDMSEFMESHLTTRLIGSPPGYAGYEQGGQLTEAVRRRPYSVILFDEIEKAHPKVFDLLLQILDDGRLTDAHGEVVNFKNTLIVLTSNAGTTYDAPSSLGFTTPASSQTPMADAQQTQLQRQIQAVLKDTFQPELLNRIDEVVIFHPLEKAHLYQIVDLMLAHTQQRLAALSIELRITDEVRDLLVLHGYERAFGARPLRRQVQSLLEDPLAEEILRGSLKSGMLVCAEVVAEQLSLRLQPAVPAAAGKAPGKGGRQDAA